jgi:hypothetical protein
LTPVKGALKSYYSAIDLNDDSNGDIDVLSLIQYNPDITLNLVNASQNKKGKEKMMMDIEENDSVDLGSGMLLPDEHQLVQSERGQ